jgi:hypothetical protein
MRTIIFGFSRPTHFGAFAAAIMWWDDFRKVPGPQISHGFVKFVSAAWETSFIYQASGIRTNFEGEQSFLEHAQIVEEFPIQVSEETFNKIGKFVVGRENRPYAIKQTLGMGLVIAAYLLSFGQVLVANPFADGGVTTNCIEEMSIILAEEFGTQVPMNMDSASVRPFRNWIASEIVTIQNKV